MGVTVCIGTYGDESWIATAQRAIRSAETQAPVIHRHSDTLANARNEALGEVETEWVVHLDADDELEPGYIEALNQGTADLRAPAVRYIRGGGASMPRVPRVAGHRHACTAECLSEGNFICVGALAPTALLREVGGWREYPWSEDWDAWLRCWRAGATVESIPSAVYRAHVRRDSRNRAPDPAFKNKVHWDIHRANFPELYEEVA